ncbi:MAG: methionyl-tRNA formyltransferase [Elusimicrobiota bacterium]
MRVLFFGTPQIAVPFLDWLEKHTTVAGVICRPDQPVGRGYEVTEPPTKVFANSKNIPVFQPAGPWTDDFVETLKKTESDIGIVVAYGRILPEKIFLTPKLGCINIHFSLLPQYRGAAPMQWSLIKGEKKTGVSAFWLEQGLDSGPLCAQISTSLENEYLPELREKLTQIGVQVLEKLIDQLNKGQIVKTLQEGVVSLAPQLKKEDGRINWDKPAQDIVNLIRGVCEWPGASTTYLWGGIPKQLKIFKAIAEDTHHSNMKPGLIVQADKNGIVVQTSQGRICLIQVQPEGKKPMDAWAFWQGARLKKGDQLG